jgi:Mn-dependent DtxR family transcriptional regulator
MTDVDRIDELIIELLRESEKPMSTYKIAKEAKIAWSTVNIHCYKLKSIKLLEEKTTISPIGQKKVTWKLTAKTPTLDKFIKK